MARLDERRVKRENENNYGLPYFKCPNVSCVMHFYLVLGAMVLNG